MTARVPPSRTTHVQINGDIRSQRQDREYVGKPATVMNSGDSPDDVGGTGGTPRFRHIKDLQAKAQAQARDSGPMTPIRTLLHRAQQSASQASSLIGFKQVDRAYVEHLVSSDILLNIIPRHKDYPYMHGGNGEWYRSYVATRKQVDGQYTMFREVYDIILEDNVRSGIRPSVTTSGRNSLPHKGEEARHAPNSSPRPLSMLDRPVTSRRIPDELFLDQRSAPCQHTVGPRRSIEEKPFARSSTPPRDRPPVRPKPDTLNMHGAAPKDLAQRFSQLKIQRKNVPSQLEAGAIHVAEAEMVMPSPTEFTPPSSNSSPSSASHRYSMTTDTSLSTRPSGPRAMPPHQPTPTPPHPPKIPLEPIQNFSFPRAPSPAYDPSKSVQLNGVPTRSTIRNKHPSSTESTSLRSAPPSSCRASGANGVGSSPRLDHDNRPLRMKTLLRETSPATFIEAEDLMKALRSSDVLTIDVRNRAEYDQGHIFAKNVMCIEPVSLRSNMSADELEESLILSTSNEQALFERRNEFDVVVYYDQETDSDRFLNGPPTNSNRSALRAIHDCLYEFNYDKQLQRRPVMLLGGLEAWIDLVGPQALAVTQTAAQLGSTQARPTRKSGRPIGRVPMVSANSSLEVRKRRLRDHNPLNPDEEKSWLEKARREEVPSGDYSHAQSDSDAESTDLRPDQPPSPFVQSYDEFLRKFPEPSGVRQSMVSSRPPPPPPPTRTAPAMPGPPSRPAPAVPRPSYSGVGERDALHLSPTSRQPSSQLPLYTPRSFSHRRKLPVTGLVNFSVTCYMNATIQCLMATLPLSNFFLEDHWRRYTQKNWKGSNGIMPEIYANLIRSLWKGDVNAIRPSSLRNLCARLNQEWGVDRQQDAKEFFDFLLDCLHEDLNFHWQNAPYRPLTFQEEITQERMPVAQASMLQWQRYTHREQSFIIDHFAGQHASRLRCTTCNNTSTTYEAFFSISVEIPRKGSGDIYDCLRSYCQEEKLSKDEMWKCPYCKCEREATKKITITRAPQILVVHFKRFSASKSETARKLHTPINFPLHQLNVGPYMTPPPSAKDAYAVRDTSDQATTPPFVYDCYAVMRHLGTSLSGGHYIALVSDRNKGVWRKFDDQYSSDFRPEDLKPAQRLQNEQAYLIFYSRAAAR